MEAGRLDGPNIILRSSAAPGPLAWVDTGKAAGAPVGRCRGPRGLDVGEQPRTLGGGGRCCAIPRLGPPPDREAALYR